MLDEVHLYLKGGTQLQDLKSGTNVEIPFSEIIRAEIYTKDKGKTLASWLIPGIGIPVVIIVIAVITGRSSFTIGSNKHSPL